MKYKYSTLLILTLAFLSSHLKAQETVYPAGPQKGTTAIIHATVHVGNGTVLTDATIVFEKGKITAVGSGGIVTGKQYVGCKR